MSTMNLPQLSSSAPFWLRCFKCFTVHSRSLRISLNSLFMAVLTRNVKLGLFYWIVIHKGLIWCMHIYETRMDNQKIEEVLFESELQYLPLNSKLNRINSLLYRSLHLKFEISKSTSALKFPIIKISQLFRY